MIKLKERNFIEKDWQVDIYRKLDTGSQARYIQKGKELYPGWTAFNRGTWKRADTLIVIRCEGYLGFKLV